MKNLGRADTTLAAIVALATAGAASAVHAADFAPPGAKATLSVAYRFESSGKTGPNRDKTLLSHEWQTQRSVDLKADLLAAKPTLLPTMQPVDPAQAARLDQQQVQARKTAAQAAPATMAPMMADAQAIVARCGDDEKCIERETMKLGAAMSGTKQLDDTLKAGKAAADSGAALQSGANRYQAWRVSAQSGTYSIEQRSRIEHADPGCMAMPGGRCTREQVGKGAGAVPPAPNGVTASAAGVEFDAQANTLALLLPAPMNALPYSETVSGNEPKDTQSMAYGTHPRQLLFRAGADKPTVVALKGGWRSQSGEQLVQVKGDAGEAGTLRVRWQLIVQ